MSDSVERAPDDSSKDVAAFEQVRAEVEDRQKSILWEDQFRNNRHVTDFLWRGDPNARLIQRAGLIVFGLFFLLISAVVFLGNFEKDPEERSIVAVFWGLLMFLMALRLFRNALLRPRPQAPVALPPDNEGPAA